MLFFFFEFLWVFKRNLMLTSISFHFYAFPAEVRDKHETGDVFDTQCNAVQFFWMSSRLGIAERSVKFPLTSSCFQKLWRRENSFDTDCCWYRNRSIPFISGKIVCAFFCIIQSNCLRWRAFLCSSVFRFLAEKYYAKKVRSIRCLVYSFLVAGMLKRTVFICKFSYYAFTNIFHQSFYHL